MERILKTLAPQRLLPALAAALLIPIGWCVIVWVEKTDPDPSNQGESDSPSLLASPETAGSEAVGGPNQANRTPQVQLICDGVGYEVNKRSVVSIPKGSTAWLCVMAANGLAEAPFITGGRGVRIGPSISTDDGSYRRPVKLTFDGTAEVTVATVEQDGTRTERLICFREPGSSPSAPLQEQLK